MMAKYTPGDWFLSASGAYVGRLTSDGSHDIICELNDGVGLDGVEICSEANGRLITAATNAAMNANADNPVAAAEALPQMLEACEAIMHLDWRRYDNGDIELRLPSNVARQLENILRGLK